MADETYHALTSFWKIDPIIHAQGNRKCCLATRDLLAIVGCAGGQIDLRPVRVAETLAELHCDLDN